MVAAYAPTVISSAESKDEFYAKLTGITNKYKKKGIVYICADMNAKLRYPGDLTEGIGAYVLRPKVYTREGEGVEDSRYRMQEYLIRTKAILTNTTFPKQNQELITYNIDKTKGNRAPFEQGPYDTFDYFITHRKWRNTVKNVSSDMLAGLDTDHFPLIADIRAQLKADYKKNNKDLNTKDAHKNNKTFSHAF